MVVEKKHFGEKNCTSCAVVCEAQRLYLIGNNNDPDEFYDEDKLINLGESTSCKECLNGGFSGWMDKYCGAPEYYWLNTDLLLPVYVLTDTHRSPILKIYQNSKEDHTQFYIGSCMLCNNKGEWVYVEIPRKQIDKIITGERIDMSFIGEHLDSLPLTYWILTDISMTIENGVRGKYNEMINHSNFIITKGDMII